MNDTNENLDLVDLIDMLAEIPEPPAISMVPQTGGWIVLGLAVVALLAFAIWRGAMRYRANAYRRAALKALESAGDDPATIGEIVRRTALAAYPRESVASLSGDAWLRFLDAGIAGSAFSQGPGRILADGPYRSSLAPPELGALAGQWVRKHRVDRQP